MRAFLFRLMLLIAAPSICVLADDASQINELVLANRILTMNGVLDAYGHVSVRSERDPKHFFLARHIPAGVVTRATLQNMTWIANAWAVIRTQATPSASFMARFIGPGRT